MPLALTDKLEGWCTNPPYVPVAVHHLSAPRPARSAWVAAHRWDDSTDWRRSSPSFSEKLVTAHEKMTENPLGND